MQREFLIPGQYLTKCARYWRHEIFFLVLVTVSGCATYHPMPITEESASTKLHPPDMAQVRVLAREIKHPILHPVELKADEGLSPDGAAVLAVLLNPSLRAVRDQRALSDAQILGVLELHDRQASIRLSESQTITGIVRQVLPIASSTGAVTVWIESPQINAQLRPGQTVGGDIVAQSRSGVLAVPEAAIVYDAQDHPFLFVGKDGAYERLGIQTGIAQDGWIEVLSGLKEDQSVVVRGAYELFYRKFNEQFKVQD